MKISIKKPKEIELMRKTCQIAAEVLVFIEPHIKPGISTEYLNGLCHNFIVEKGGYPSPLNYKGFPKSICTSVNEVVCHGIPTPNVILKDGDIVNVDITVFKHQFHGDTSRTFKVGNTHAPEVSNLVSRTYEAMMKGIEVVKPGGRFCDVGNAIDAFIKPFGYGIVRDYCGHGIGRIFHEDPSVMHYANNMDILFREGMTFTVEPMINLGSYEVKQLDDGWTVVTKDRTWSAQFEHTILVTSSGLEILTLPAS